MGKTSKSDVNADILQRLEAVELALTAKPINEAEWLKVIKALGRSNTAPYKEYLKRYTPPPVGANSQ
jgi:hypothetical protein